MILTHSAVNHSRRPSNWMLYEELVALCLTTILVSWVLYIRKDVSFPSDVTVFMFFRRRVGPVIPLDTGFTLQSPLATRTVCAGTILFPGHHWGGHEYLVIISKADLCCVPVYFSCELRGLTFYVIGVEGDLYFSCLGTAVCHQQLSAPRC